MKKIFLVIALALFAFHAAAAQPAEGVPKTILPLSLLKEIIHEASGDLALQNEILIAGVNRNRLPEEYVQGYFETSFILAKLKEYGITDAQIIDLPTRGATTWDAEIGRALDHQARQAQDRRPQGGRRPRSARAARRRTSRPSSSTSARAIARSSTRGRTSRARSSWSTARPAAPRPWPSKSSAPLGLIGYSSSHPEFDPDEVGWSSVRSADNMKTTFGFMISTRQGNELRDQLERGAKIEVRAVAKAQMVPYKEQMVEALIPGTDLPNEELVFTAHLYEGFAKQGANDDISRLRRHPRDGPDRSRSSWTTARSRPSSGRSASCSSPRSPGRRPTSGNIPEIAKRFFANINEDMVGEGLIKNQSLFELVQTPWSLPTYLNDVMRVVRTSGSGRRSATTSGPRPISRSGRPTGIARPVLLRHRPVLGRERPHRLRRRRRPRPGGHVHRLAGPVVPHEPRHRRQVRLDPAQAGRVHRRGRGRAPGRGGPGRGADPDQRGLDAVARAARRAEGAGGEPAPRGRQGQAPRRLPRRRQHPRRRPSPTSRTRWPRSGSSSGATPRSRRSSRATSRPSANSARPMAGASRSCT